MFVVIKFEGKTHKLNYLFSYLLIFLPLGHSNIIYNFYPLIAHLLLQRLPFYGVFSLPISF
jgi:hypothetical protein